MSIELFGSAELASEEQELRKELVEWVKAKLRKGHRPVPLQAAFYILADWMNYPDKYGLR